LNRQTLFTEDDIGKKKVEVLEKKIKNINPESSIFTLKTRLILSNIKKTFSDYHYILDCSDNFHTRFLINEFCHKMKKILVTAALQNFDLQAAIFKSWEGINPCYECFFSSDNKYPQDSCDQMGIVATVAGIGGALQGQLLINNVLNKHANFSQIILFSCSNIRMRKIGLNKNRNCKICKSS
jgi:adenylyltransferase/sulfurtransferase